ncbi:Plasmodium exported protein, unknown function [Plasmodium vivax]|uniref:Fam-l protein n=1 Tax=Plasmodium vivax TaxID=5855 RepID=A0A565A6J1_PLAVI|nr:Plasmodium exported protein, unknown function [Plasmodium vivax]
MTAMKYSYIKHKLYDHVFTRIATFMILSCMLFYHNDMNVSSKSLENGRKIDKSLDIRAYRLLAKYSDKSEFQRSRLQNEANDDRYNHKLRNEKVNNNTYEHLKHDRLNNVDTYLKGYKSRYAKKKGLKRFDCYYEKKIFNSINKIEKMVEHKNINKKNLKKLLYKKYGIPFIMISLIPLLGLIIPITFYKDIHLDSDPKTCLDLFKKKPDDSKPYIRMIKIYHRDCNLLPIECEIINRSFFAFLALGIISFIIYTYIKLQKYRRIKAGMFK